MLRVSISLVLALSFSLVNAQQLTTTAAVSDNSTTVIQQQPMDKPVGLPNVEWDILRIDPASRENLCARQMAYCSNNCGGPKEAAKNFCNATSMAWGCGCFRKTPDFTPFLWPVVQAECSGKLQECQMICNADKVQHSTCATTCNAYYQCGTDKAPPSYLQTENPNDAPSYNGPPKNIAAKNNAGGTTNSQNSGSTLIIANMFVVSTWVAAMLSPYL